ncbi:hypothetical protein Lnau_0939 [Legionella nautarum]|uniref:Peptidase C58 YopT-type domain-containing protein n=1 Tax=Legionella nautarum TaxID=45070 RepID=A0A0W0WUE4_9GAMM|nr:hypothetical protein [Legionella nautarum]KTD35955.1 hypothetical protein Lnau_0939 [Legionella nautarum]
MGKKTTLGQLLATNTFDDPFMAAAIFNEDYPVIHEVDTLLSSVFSLLNVSQDVFMHQYNLHRERMQLPEVEEGGWCHGLTLTWLKYAARNRQKEFFDIYNMVIRGMEVSQMDCEKIEEFYTEIDKAQHPGNYYPNTGQESIEVILGVPEIKTSADPKREGFKARKWQNILSNFMKNYDMIRISAFSGRSHTIGIFKDKGGFYLYDCNNASENVTEFKQFSSLQAINWIKNNLYAKLKLEATQSTPMKLTITGINSSMLLERDEQNISDSTPLIPGNVPEASDNRLSSENRKRKRELPECKSVNQSAPTTNSSSNEFSFFNTKLGEKRCPDVSTLTFTV